MHILLLIWRQILGKSGVSQQGSQSISLVELNSEWAFGQIFHHILYFLHKMVSDQGYVQLWGSISVIKWKKKFQVGGKYKGE